MLYYEEAEVKEYYRKDSKGNKKPYYQIGVKKKSKFNKPKPIALIDVDEIKELESFLEANPIEEQKAKLNELEEENSSLKKELSEIKQELKKLKEEKLQLQEDLLNEKDNNKKVIELAKYEAKVKELDKEKDISKTLLLALYSYEERGFFKGLLNKTPDLAKQILKDNPKPIETKPS